MTTAQRKIVGETLTPAQALALAGSAVLARPDGPARVVILGGGFAGVYTAKYLTALLGSRKDVEVELLSAENYFVFQPLLPQRASTRRRNAAPRQRLRSREGTAPDGDQSALHRTHRATISGRFGTQCSPSSSPAVTRHLQSAQTWMSAMS